MSVLKRSGRWLAGTLVRVDALEVGGPSDIEKARRYAASSDMFPPIYVIGRTVLDGLHRVAAARLRGEMLIPAEGCLFGGIVATESEVTAHLERLNSRT